MRVYDSADLTMPEPRTATIQGTGLAPVLDRTERVLVLLLYAQMVFRLVRDAIVLQNPMAMLLLPSEGIVIALVLLRKPAREMSGRWLDWGAALAATSLPTFIVATERQASPLFVQLAACLALAGLCVQVHAKLTLGRCFGLVAANRGIRSAGPYRWVRHPMYLGYAMSFIAFLCTNWCLWNASLFLMVIALQVYRMLAEERVLGLDPQYQEYEARVRWRILPGVF